MHVRTYTRVFYEKQLMPSFVPERSDIPCTYLPQIKHMYYWYALLRQRLSIRLPAAAAVCDTSMYELNTARVLTLPEVDLRSLGQA